MKVLVLLTIALSTSFAFGAIQTETVEYKHGDVTLEGVVTYDDSLPGKRPGILVAHQWKGLSDYEKKRSRMLAELGYVAFAIDIYGKGVRPSDAKQAQELSGKYKSDRMLLRERAAAGLDVLKKHALVDASKVGAIGYCFGGATVLELARAGAPLEGVVSFHGALNAPFTNRTAPINARILALHGADDPFVPPAETKAFEQEMRDAKADWQLVSYGNAVHSFTDFSAGTDNSKGAAYNEKADRRSWEAMKQFLSELFR